MRKCKRENKELYIALLDITKAYDRVPRDLLWRKMELLGVPLKLLHAVEAIYSDPKSILWFQDVCTEPIPMKIGLRQGCVLSPILFAIYMADLGWSLSNANLGVEIGDVRLPGMFFADDIVLWGTQVQLQKMLDILSAWADMWKTEFSGTKSFVIPIRARNVASTQRQWVLGTKMVSESEQRTVYMVEEEEGRYLGITIRARESIYHPQHQVAIKKAGQLVGMSIRALKQLNNPNYLLKRIWETYAVPCYLYGADIASWSPAVLQKLDVIVHNMIRVVYRLPGTVPNDALYALTGLMPSWVSVCARHVGYLDYIRALPGTRWARMAYEVQKSWAIQDGIVDHNFRILNGSFRFRGMYWLKGCILLASKLGMDMTSLYTKQSRRKQVRTKWMDLLEAKMATHPSLKWYDTPLGIVDHEFDVKKHNWWLKARIGGLRFTKFRQDEKVCELCGQSVIDLTHFMLDCTALPAMPDVPGNDRETAMKHILGAETDGYWRSQMDHWIRLRWKCREQKLQFIAQTGWAPYLGPRGPRKCTRICSDLYQLI